MASATASASTPADTAEPFSADLCWLMAQASHALTTELTAALEGLGVSPRAYSVLLAATCGSQTQTELAKLVGLDKTTMVVTLDELEAAGFAERLPSPADRRVRVIAVTAAGRRKVREAKRISGALTDEVVGTLPPRERTAFLDALTRLVAGRLATPAVCSQKPRRPAQRM